MVQPWGTNMMWAVTILIDNVYLRSAGLGTQIASNNEPGFVLLSFNYLCYNS